MSLRDGFLLAWSSVTAHRLRSALTMLGILIGIASVILLTSIGEGTRRYVLGEFTQFGTNVIAIHPGKVETSGIPGAIGATERKLTLDDAVALLRVPQVDKVVPLAIGMAEVELGERGRSVFVYGVTSDVPAVWKFRIGRGRFLPPGDPNRSTPVAVLGPKLKRELFGERNPLGSYVRIGGRRFQVIGVMEAKGQLLGFDIDDAAYIPVKSAQDLFGTDELQEIDVMVPVGVDSRAVGDRVKRTLRERHDGVEDFTVTTQTDMLEVLGRILSIVSVAVGAIGGVSLVVGAIGILTMMWIAVNERTAEIGLSRALGATPSQIQLLFLFEAALLSVAGGALGVVAGISTAAVIKWFVPGMPVHTPPEFVAAALAMSLLVGLASGVLPARRAARLDPVEALHAE